MAQEEIHELAEEHNPVHVSVERSAYIQIGLTAKNLEQLDLANHKLNRKRTSHSPSKIMQKYF